jgi:uncharacterized protein YcbK (DUF882 family)
MTMSRSTLCSRRRVIAAAGALAVAPLLALARPARATSSARALAFEHTHTGERLALTYAEGDMYVPEALQAIDHFLRDFRNGATHPIDPVLLDALHALTRVTGSGRPFEVISGYRSPATNDGLRERGHGVASNSLHLAGRAIDIRLRGVTLADLRDAALALHAGGVGYYPASDFVHVDTGRVRRW